MITTIAEWTETWGKDLLLVGCRHCDGTFLAQAQPALATCLYCGKADPDVMDAEADRPVYTQAPELVLPFSVPRSILEARLTDFAKRSWFAPADLTPENLLQRLRLLYLPMWLVDTSVEAQWHAEVGFDYDVVSHQERFENGEWHTQEMRKTRIRWEPRVGTLQRLYENQSVPALEEQEQLQRLLGNFDFSKQLPFQRGDVAAAGVHLPNRPPADAWPEARAAFKVTAAAECQQAAQADHIRDFRWSADFRNQNWTQLLFPLYTTRYVDDEGVTRMVYLHGQSGRLRGQRRASKQKARRWSWAVAGVAAACFVLGAIFTLLGTFADFWLTLAAVVMVLAIFAGIAAILPLSVAWGVNSFGHFYDDRQTLLPELTDIAWVPSGEE